MVSDLLVDGGKMTKLRDPVRAIFLVHYIRREGGITTELIKELTSLSNDSSAIYFEYLPPNGILIVFPQDKKQKSQQFAETVKSFVSSKEEWRDVRASAREGSLLAQMDDQGVIVSTPYGLVINEAIDETLK